MVIDGEAGIEQVNRRVMEKVTHLVLVSDASKKGIEVTKTIKKVAGELVMYETDGLILNRVNEHVDVRKLDLDSLTLLSVIPDDKEMMLSDVEGRSVFSLDEKANILTGVKTALTKLGIL